MFISIIAIAILTSVVGCGENNSQLNKLQTVAKMNKESKQQIELLLGEYKNSLNTSNAELSASLYTEDGVFMPSEAPSAVGKENIKAAYDFIFSQIQLNVEFTIEEVFVEDRMAFAVTTSNGTTLIHANGQTIPEENRELFVFKKENRTWKIARYMFNKMSAPAAVEPEIEAME